MAASSRRQGGTELLIVVSKVRHLPTWRRPWGNISFAPMVASSRIDRGDRAANRCAKGVTLTHLEVTVGTYQLRIDRGDRAANRCAKGTSLTDLEVTVGMGIYQLCSCGG